MKLGAREITIIVSLGIHGAVAAMAISVAHDKQAHRATTVSLAEQKKKDKPEDKKPPPPPPPPVPPKVKPVAPKHVAAPVPVAAAPEPVSTPAAAAAPMQTDIAMSNDTGMDMGTGVKPKDEIKGAPTTAPTKPKPAAASVKTPIHVDAPPPRQGDAGACTEPPGKPEPSLKTDIEYTEEARAAGIEGRLVLKVTVDADGNVTDVKVVSGVDAALDASAIQTVKTWRFKPAMACGKPVSGGTYTIARRFVLGD